MNVELKDEKDDEKSLVLVPNVLEGVHSYSVYVQNYGGIMGSNIVPPLSIIFEIMRGYKMPELYESRAMVGTW